MNEATFEQWAALELMGHRRRYGLCREVEIAGGKMMRVDIPYEAGEVTEFYGTSAIYSILPCEEEMCRDAVRADDPRPVRPVQYQLKEEQEEFRSDTKYTAWDEQDQGV